MTEKTQNYHITKDLSDWVSGFSLDQVPEDVQTRAKHLILDGIACGLVGAHLPWSTKAAETLFSVSPKGSANVIGWNKTLPPLDAALLNSSFIQGFELDDWHSQAPLHSNSILLPAVFSAAQHLKASSDRKVTGKDILTAVLAGFEVGPRVGKSLWGEHILSMGWHSGAVFGPAASVAATSNLLNLTASQIEDAFGTACTQACGLMSAQFGSDTKRMQHGFAARNGLLATFLAQAGYSGIKDVFELPYGGFLKQFSAGNGKEPSYLPDELTRDLGTYWQTKNICCKPYSSMAATHPTIDCIHNLQVQYPDLKGPDAAKLIKSIKITMSVPAYEHGGFQISRPIETTGAQMSIAFVSATQIVHGSVLPGNFRRENLEDNNVWDLVSKTQCIKSEDKNIPFGQQTVEICMMDGKLYETTVKSARGVDPPLSNEHLVQKYDDLTAEVIPEERAERIKSIALGLDKVEDIEELFKLLTMETRNPIA